MSPSLGTGGEAEDAPPLSPPARAPGSLCATTRREEPDPDRTLVSALLPPGVRTAEEFGDPEGGFLFPEEEAWIAKAVEKRRREFTTARMCARRALAALGCPAVPLVPGRRGAPAWPASFVGSMTHCAGYRAAAVACRGDVVSLGVDAEPHEPVPEGIVAMVALPEEQRMLADLARHDSTLHWDRLLFSAKESVYKTWFPLVGSWLGFDDAVIDIDPDGGVLRARLLREGRDREGRQLRELHGRWRVGRGLILTAVVHRP
ncbi:4'-phosphopantetheinyl transferase superfamily protein [Streptomyces sp. NBC_00365]|uniref:4'-phosphopantetheinyl transferase family protein n=1 Tax=Streptomyces sp. NBC_00365 TaxID=2975726 RepID=UPI0022540CEA|nr:4'-phosphopantetheinyl transferase superfamily protein [Streptomyces sp. NBC_00365]MCX5096609.1 4'-phosphopantetheinyl transferase superfamily protein [Streptomyces sp. NBC_00365]